MLAIASTHSAASIDSEFFHACLVNASKATCMNSAIVITTEKKFVLYKNYRALYIHSVVPTGTHVHG